MQEMGFFPGLRRPPGGENNNPFQYSCLENPTEEPECTHTEEPEGPQPVGLQGVEHDLATEHTHTQGRTEGARHMQKLVPGYRCGASGTVRAFLLRFLPHSKGTEEEHGMCENAVISQQREKRTPNLFLGCPTQITKWRKKEASDSEQNFCLWIKTPLSCATGTRARWRAKGKETKNLLYALRKTWG